MQSRGLRDNTIAILALIALLVCAYGLDAALHRWRLYAQQTFELLPYMWSGTLISLSAAAIVLSFAYWLVTRSAAHRLVGLVYLIVGVLAVVYVPLVFTFHLRLPLLLATLSGPISYYVLHRLRHGSRRSLSPAAASRGDIASAARTSSSVTPYSSATWSAVMPPASEQNLWIVVGPTLLFPVWGVALAVAALGYYFRRRGLCRVCGRGSPSAIPPNPVQSVTHSPRPG